PRSVLFCSFFLVLFLFLFFCSFSVVVRRSLVLFLSFYCTLRMSSFFAPPPPSLPIKQKKTKKKKKKKKNIYFFFFFLFFFFFFYVLFPVSFYWTTIHFPTPLSWVEPLLSFTRTRKIVPFFIFF